MCVVSRWIAVALAAATFAGCGTTDVHATGDTPTSAQVQADTTVRPQSEAGDSGSPLDLPTSVPQTLAPPVTVVPPALDLPDVTAELELASCELTVSVPNEVIGFAFDSASIASAGHEVLTKVIREMRTAKVVNIVGHSSSEGDDAYNRRLSEHRAEAVHQIAVAVLPDMQFEVSGVGSQQPLVDEDGTEASRSRNRRVVISGRIESEQCAPVGTIPHG